MNHNPDEPGGSGGPSRVLDEIAKLMTDAAGVAQGMRKEAETVFKSQAERMLNGLDLVKRDDFDAVREMAANARQENDWLSERIKALEARLAQLEGNPSTGKKSPVKPVLKPAGKTPSKKPVRRRSKAATRKDASK